MKILIINASIGYGSVGRIVSDLYHGIIMAGHECKVAYGRDNNGDVPQVDTYKICSEVEVYLHAGLTRCFGNTAFYFAKTTKIFCNWIKDYDPDIVHIHGVYGYYLNMEVLFSYLSKSRTTVISTLHSCWDFTGHCCYFDYVGCDQWKTGCVHCLQKSTYPASSFLDNTESNYKRKKSAYASLKNCVIVTPSEWLKCYVEQSFLKNKKVYVIDNGIDTDFFKPILKKSHKFYFDKPSILCVANNWEPRKGWQDVVELSKIVGSMVQLIVVGLNAKQAKQLPDNVLKIMKTNSKNELAELYSSATVFFNPTYEDNYPTVNLEAVACHTPIVTYDTGGSSEIFQYGDWGKVIPKKDFASLIKFTNDVYREIVKIDFSNSYKLSKRNMINKYMSLYENILNYNQ